MKSDFFRVAAAVPAVSIADPAANADSIIEQIRHLNDRQVDLAVFPELCVTAYTCGDLFHSSILLDASDEALRRIAQATEGLNIVAIVGAPVRHNNALYNCGVAIGRGRILMMVPKTYLPNYNEFYEKRLWTSGASVDTTVNGIPLTTRQILDINGVGVGIEICEDLWTAIPPSSTTSLAGAQIIANLSASDDIIGKYAYLRSLISQQSARCLCGYVYASAGYGESSTDLVFDGKAIIAENGTILAANDRWQHQPQYVISDIDLMALNRDRLHTGSFTDCATLNLNQSASQGFRTISLPQQPENPADSINGEIPDSDTFPTQLMRRVDPHPFIPVDDSEIDQRCNEIISIQVAGLARRLEATKCRILVVGISGGLDSTPVSYTHLRAHET